MKELISILDEFCSVFERHDSSKTDLNDIKRQIKRYHYALCAGYGR